MRTCKECRDWEPLGDGKLGGKCLSRKRLCMSDDSSQAPHDAYMYCTGHGMLITGPEAFCPHWTPTQETC